MTLVVPVDDLKSMEMAKVKSGDYSVAGPHEALQGGNFPYVEFRLEDEALGRPNQDGVYPLKASGKLALAGVTKDIPLQAEAVFSGTQVEVRGSAQILLKDYKVAPRSDIWGPMKPPSVEVHFDVVFGPEKPTLPSFPK